MSGSDVYTDTAVPNADWSSTVVYNAAQNGNPATVQVGSVASDAASLSGTVSQSGDLVTFTTSGYDGPFQEQLQAVCDITDGAVFVDPGGNYFLFSDDALTDGASYDVVAGFGAFTAGQATCFAAGTRIETQRGLVAVEALRPGERVRCVPRNGSQSAVLWRSVVWTGHRQVLCRAHRCPQAVWPVRVAAHAFAPGQPGRDLFLSPGHAVLTDGALVPIRHLLNDATIAQVPRASVTYWHVELDAHDVLLAEGLPAESFLDTGNRGFFAPSGPLEIGETDATAPEDARGREDRAKLAWATRACAPLLDDPARQASIRLRLRQRAIGCGWRETGDASLRLHAGPVTLPCAWDGAILRATVPAGLSALHLMSRSAVPWQQVDGSSDERRLGVAVTRIRLDGRQVPLSDRCLGSGWHAAETGLRWTCGHAAVALPPSRESVTIEIETAPMLRYWEWPDSDRLPLAA